MPELIRGGKSSLRPAVVILPEPPYPPDCGNALRDVQQITLLSRLGYDIVLVCARPRPRERRRDDGCDAPDGVTVRFCRPEAVSEKARVFSAILRKASYLWPGNDAYPFGWWLRFYEPDLRLPALIEQLRPSVIVMRSVFLEWLPAIRQMASCPIVVDCHDDDLQLAAEMVQSVPVSRRLGPWANYLGTRTALKHLLPFADEVWAVSEEDACGLRRFAGGRPVLTVPSGVDERRIVPTAVAGRNGICALVANFAYGPNLTGATWFASKVWPPIRAQVPSAELWLVGGGAAETLAALCQSHPGLRAFGRVPNLATVYEEAAVMIAPILYGGGSRLKIVEAWKNGKAVAGTTKGFQGLGAPSDATAVADTSSGLASVIGDLLTDTQARLTLGTRALAFVSSRYSWQVIASKLRGASIVARSTAV